MEEDRIEVTSVLTTSISVVSPLPERSVMSASPLSMAVSVVSSVDLEVME